MIPAHDWEYERLGKEWAGLRPWLTAEYSVMTEQEVEEMKAYWDAQPEDGVDNSGSCAIV